MRWVSAYNIKRSDVQDVAITSNITWVLKKIVSFKDILTRVGGWSAISSSLSFSIKKTYQKLQGDNERVEWRRPVCNNKATPKSIFILCLSLLNRLAAATRLHHCDMNVSPLCKVCGQEVETTHHLFFTCGYRNEVWKKVLGISTVNLRLMQRRSLKYL